jgi:hypothetical protein
MDVLRYANAEYLFRRMAGRLSDDVLSTVQEDFAAGEEQMAMSILLLNAHYQGVAITPGEVELCRSLLDDPADPDLLQVTVVDPLPPPDYRFSPTAPAGAPDPARVDEAIVGLAARVGVLGVRRSWRAPGPAGPNPARWIYLVRVAPGTDRLRAYSSIAAELSIELRDKSPVTVLADGAELTPYLAAAAAASHVVLGTD